MTVASAESASCAQRFFQSGGDSSARFTSTTVWENKTPRALYEKLNRSGGFARGQPELFGGLAQLHEGIQTGRLRGVHTGTEFLSPCGIRRGDGGAEKHDGHAVERAIPPQYFDNGFSVNARKIEIHQNHIRDFTRRSDCLTE